MRLTKKQVKTADTKVLNFRYCRLLQKAEKREAISIGEAREILWIEDELHQRLLNQLGRDPYPPDRIEKEIPSNYMISLLKSGTAKKVEQEKKTEGNLRFKITIKSSIGSVVKTLNAKVDSRSGATSLAIETIKQLGLKKATYKIS